MLFQCTILVRHLTCGIKRRIITSTIALSVIICVTILRSYSDLPVTVENNKCYTDTENDVLPSIPGDFDSPARSIHFHEASCEGKLDSRQACAVESAALAHPHWQINVFFASPVTYENLKKSFMPLPYHNIKVFRINIVEYVKGTPLVSLFNDGFSKSGFETIHMPDALKYLTLYKWGGVHLDLDMIVARSFDDLGLNWAAVHFHKFENIGTGALAFSKMSIGSRVAALALRDFRINFKNWMYEGLDAVTRVWSKICSNKIKNILKEPCDFQIYESTLFYPLKCYDPTESIGPEELGLGNLEPYTYNVDASIGKNMKLSNRSLIARLAQMYCPKVYEYYGDKFGL